MAANGSSKSQQGSAVQFVPPNDDARRKAIGPVDQFPLTVRRLLDPTGFTLIGAPGPEDWLANQSEPGQTFREFAQSHPNFPDATRRTICLQPLDEFPADGPSLSVLKNFTEAFFAMPVRILPVVPHLDKVQSRISSSTGQRQLFTPDMLSMLAQRLPRDAYCLLGVTLQDLYPDPAWNYVFGQASFSQRVGVYSLLRYDPRFYGENSSKRSSLMLRRSCKLLAHETGHMFGINHCIYFRCAMNGTNHLGETDASPLHLCPVDLRKLLVSIQFDPVARYAHLRDFCREAGFTDEAAWIDGQLARVADIHG